MVGSKCNKSLQSQIDISILRDLRSQGKTNKQIASEVGCSVATVYKYLGKRSLDVAWAEAKRLPPPVTAEKIRENRNDIQDPKPSVEKAKASLEKAKKIAQEVVDGIKQGVVTGVAEIACAGISKEEPKHSLLKAKETHVLDLEGKTSRYKVDLLSGDITFSNGLIEGMITKQDLATFIEELTELKNTIGG